MQTIRGMLYEGFIGLFVDYELYECERYECEDVGSGICVGDQLF